jgi:hypothetical protein
MAINLSDNIQNNSNKPLDNKFGPYSSVANAVHPTNGVPSTSRYKGLTVGIETSGVITEYWFKNGIADADLVLKQVPAITTWNGTTVYKEGDIVRVLVNSRWEGFVRTNANPNTTTTSPTLDTLFVNWTPYGAYSLPLLIAKDDSTYTTTVENKNYWSELVFKFPRGIYRLADDWMEMYSSINNDDRGYDFIDEGGWYTGGSSGANSGNYVSQASWKSTDRASGVVSDLNTASVSPIADYTKSEIRFSFINSTNPTLVPNRAYNIYEVFVDKDGLFYRSGSTKTYVASKTLADKWGSKENGVIKNSTEPTSTTENPLIDKQLWVDTSSEPYKLKQYSLSTTSWIPIGQDVYIRKTFDEIDALRVAGKLMPGTFYTITDHQTIHTIPNTTALNVQGITYESAASWDYNATTKTEGIEELTIRAVTPSSFDILAYSTLFPNDIIHYDATNKLCEDGVTKRRGKIMYRKDTVQNIETYYDWRNVKFRRWKIKPDEYDPALTYNKYSVVKSGNIVYMCLVDGTKGVTPNSGPSIEQWAGLYNGANSSDRLGFLIAHKSSSFTVANNIPIPVDSTIFADFYTFCRLTTSGNTNQTGANLPYLSPTEVYNVVINRHNTLPYNNIIVVLRTNASGSNARINNFTIGGDCSDITFNHRVARSTIGISSSNTFISGCVNLVTGSGFTSNFLNGDVTNSYFANDANTNMSYLGIAEMHVSSKYFTNNIFKWGSNYMTFNMVSRDNLFYNTPSGSVSNCVIINCIFKGAIDRSVFNRWMQDKTFSSTCIDRNIDFSTSSNGKHFYTTVDINGDITTTEWI